MSGWFGNSLSNISGQITNFTREVLTEGTEEVDDPATQLRLAKTQIADLLRQNESQKIEADRFKHDNIDLKERLESAELQINAISNEYRNLLTHKENEVKDLKKKQHEIVESQHKVESASGTVSSQAPVPLQFASGRTDEHDFHDVISSQHEINQLRSEVRRLDSENQRLQQSTQLQVPPGDGGDTPADSLAELQAKHKDLESKLRAELDKHQHELMTLQDVHSQKISQLKKKHKQEILNYNDQIADLHELIETDGESTAAVRKIQELQAELEQVRKDNEKVLKEKVKLEDEVAQLGAAEVRGRLDENSFTRDQAHLVSSTPKPKKNNSGDENVEVLQKKLDEQEKQFELVKTDLQLEKEALEDVLVKVRQDLRGRDDSVTQLQQDVRHREETITLLQQENEELQKELSERIREVSRDNLENDNNEELLALKKQLAQREKEIKINIANLKEKVTENAELASRLQELQMSSERKCHNLEKSLREKEDEVALVTHSLQETQEELGNVSKEQGEIGTLLSQIQTLRSEIDSQGSEISHVTSDVEQKDQQILNLTEAVTNKEEQLISGAEEKEKLKDEFDEAIGKVDQLTEELNTTCLGLEEANEQLQSMNKEKEDLETQLVCVNEERDSIMKNMEELDTQNQDAILKMIQVRDELMKKNEDLKLEVEFMKAKSTEPQTHPSDLENGGNLLEIDEEIRISKAENENLSRLNGRLEEEIDLLREKLEQAAISLNDLHMDQRQLLEEKTALENHNKEMASRIKKGREENSQLHNQVSLLEIRLQQVEQHAEIVKEKLQQSVETSFVDELQLKINEGEKMSEDHVQKIDELETRLTELQELLENSEKQNTSMASEVDRLKSFQEDMLDEKDKSALDMATKIDSLENQRRSLERELNLTEEKMQKQTKHYEKYIKELTDAKEMGASSLQTEHERLMKELHSKEKEVSELSNEWDSCQRNLTETKEMLETTIEGQKQITDLVNEKETEISKLSNEKSSLEGICEETHLKFKTLEAECDRLKYIEHNYKTISEENKRLKSEIDSISCKLREVESKETTERVESRTLDVITELESEITILSNKNHDKDNELGHFQTKIRDLENIVKKGESEIVDLKNQLIQNVNLEKQSQDSVINSLRQKLCDKDNVIASFKKEFADKQSEFEKAAEHSKNEPNNLPNELPNGDIATENGAELHTVISQKDDIISELKNNNASLLKMLEAKSHSNFGSNILSEFHHLQNEMKNLREEKEHIVSVLNEKTRECSSLKSENHKLMNVISAEKSAIVKLQEDNQELLRSQPNSVEKGMTKETVKKLSQIIRDKDMEIEAFKQKNETLTQVLQEMPVSVDKNVFARITQEKENLAKQVEAFQKDREQIILMLNQKHQESLLYHQEVQRLGTVLNDESNKHNKLEQEYSNLAKQFEDKSQQLIKVQNELINYKHKFADLDVRHQHLCKIQETMKHSVMLEHDSNTEVVNQSDPPIKCANKVQELSEIEEMQAEHSSDPDNSMQQVVSNEELDILQVKYKELTHECDRLRVDIREQSQELAEKEQTMNDLSNALLDKSQLISELNAAISEKDRLILAKDAIISDINSKLHKLEGSSIGKDSEVHNMKKHYDNMAFQLQSLQTETRDITQERDQCKNSLSQITNELSTLKESNSHLSSLVSEREFENKAFREKCDTLSALVAEKGTDHNGEVQRLMQETEAMQQQAQLFQHERDQVMFSLQQKQTEMLNFQQQALTVSQKNEKLHLELDRLRTHLIQMEEAYTQEALEAEEREKQLRDRLAVAQEKVLSQSTAVESASVQASQNLESLQLQLHVVTEQRDAALLQLGSAQETANQYATSLANLQMVLEQFQHEKESQQALELEKYDRDLRTALAEKEKLNNELLRSKGEIQDQTDALEAAQRLSEQLDRKEDAIRALKEEVQLREVALLKAEEDLQKISTVSEGKVDKVLIKNIILGYFHTPHNKRDEAIQLVGRVLGFTRQEMEQVSPKSSGWLGIPSFLKRGSVGGTTPPSTPKRVKAEHTFDKSFSELFKEFLEKESSPQHPVRLPAEAMAREEQEKHDERVRQKQQQQSKPAFNPFAAPVNATLPLQIGPSAGEDSHILMKPMRSLQSGGLYTPVVAGGESGTSSVASSGRSTPASSAVLLKDVLQS